MTANFNALAVPEELRVCPQWVCAGADKKPRNPHDPHQVASVTDPKTWGTFDEALAAGYPHVGFVFTDGDPYTGIDLDDKEESPATPEQKERHQKLIEAADSYTERSRSGRGFHIIVKGEVPRGLHRDNVEVYSSRHYFIVTGDVVRNQPIAERQGLLDTLVGEMEPSPTVELVDGDEVMDDKDLVDMAMRAADADKFNALCNGEWEELGYPSQSEADFSLLAVLASHSPSNEQVRRLFLMSKLGQRDKAQRQDYLLRTLRKARQEVGAIEHGRANAAPLIANWTAALRNKTANAGLLVRWEDFAPKESPLKLVKGLLGEGGLSVLYGEPGTGKSFVALDICVSVATGEPWMDRATAKGPVVYAVGEGISGLRLRRTAILRARNCESPTVAFLPMALDLPEEVTKLSSVLDEPAQIYGKPPVLLVVDTLNRYFGDGDENSAQAMRKFITAIDKIRQHHQGLHVMVVHHAGKDAARGMRGSSALKGAADTTIECTKQNTGTGFTYTARVDKQKDGEEVKYHFRLQQVVVGHDEDGTPISSCVVQPEREVHGRGSLTEPQREAVTLLRELARTDAAVDYKSYRERFCQLRGSHAQAVRKAAGRALKDLRDKYSAVEWAEGEEPIHILDGLRDLPI